MMTRWNAVSTLDRMLDDVMGSAMGTATSPQTFVPTVDVRANENEVIFVCDVPGVKEEDLDITLENRTLRIQGARKFQSQEGEHVMLGRAYGSFSRAYTLPDDLDDEKLAANLADGVLTIRIPKQPKARPRKITIQSHGHGNGAAKRLDE